MIKVREIQRNLHPSTNVPPTVKSRIHDICVHCIYHTIIQLFFIVGITMIYCYCVWHNALTSLHTNSGAHLNNNIAMHVDTLDFQVVFMSDLLFLHIDSIYIIVHLEMVIHCSNGTWPTFCFISFSLLVPIIICIHHVYP